MRSLYQFVIPAMAVWTLVATPPPALAAPPSKQHQARAKESKADLEANVASNREVIQLLERSKKTLQGQKGADAGGHRQAAITYIQKAMGEIRGQTSKPGH